MKAVLLLQTLEARIKELDKAIQPFAHQRTSTARFDQKLFRHHSTRLMDYMAEVEENLRHLKLQVTENKPQQVAFLAERLVAQIAALQRELATQSLRQREPAHETEKETLYEKLAQHQEFERRLQAMINDRESQLARQETLAQQQQLQRELAALEGRLQRCRQALTRIERAIERDERRS